MDSKKRKSLEAAGWRIGDAADFLKMTSEERQLLDARVETALAVRQQRKVLNMTQTQLAGRIKSSQPRVAKIGKLLPMYRSTKFSVHSPPLEDTFRSSR